MKFTLEIWRQADGNASGKFEIHEMDDISPDNSFLEMLDILNENLAGSHEEPVAFDSDCREGICGMCSLVIDGQAHGPQDHGQAEQDWSQEHTRHAGSIPLARIPGW